MLRLMRLNTVWNIDNPNDTLTCICPIMVRWCKTSPLSVGNEPANTWLYMSGVEALRSVT
jgi:hypothetical protein